MKYGYLVFAETDGRMELLGLTLEEERAVRLALDYSPLATWKEDELTVQESIRKVIHKRWKTEHRDRKITVWVERLVVTE